ncbi:MAG: Crp/Fnr family transcriptional regulator [Paracoccus sp. (in: a-proteobacteria)]|uniref:Crp/Fnr family transcriptional regulator n=1 Tax=Paracoccus sp. TaxID=267 RepID=UPI0039E646B4
MPLRGLRPALLAGLSDDERMALFSECTPLHFAATAEILSQGEPAPAAFLIVKGRVEVTFLDDDGNQVMAHIAVPGEVMGEVEMLSGKTCAATCRAQAGTDLLMFSEAILLKYLPVASVLRNFASILHSRLVRDTMLHAIAQYYPAKARICIHLHRLSGRDKDISISQSQLALLAGCTRQTVNATLAELRDQGVIELGRGQIKVLDPHRLRSLAET